MKKIKFSVDTLGCKVNLSESDFIIKELQKKGMDHVPCNENPDFCIINTCTVTSQSDRKARQIIRRIKSQNNNSKMIVTGCFVVFNKEPGWMRAKLHILHCSKSEREIQKCALRRSP